jgi:hypothetical protein
MMMHQLGPMGFMKMQQLGPAGLANSIIGIGLELLLLFTGIGLLKRRRWSGKTAIVWAIGAIIASVIGGVAGQAEMQNQLAKMAQDPNLPPGIGGFSKGIGVTSMWMGICVACAFPVFMLIWFLRPSIRAEVLTWK